MNTSISRRSFLSVSALCAVSSLLSAPSVAQASTDRTSGDRFSRLQKNGAVALHYVDPDCPELSVTVYDRKGGLVQTLDPSCVKVRKVGTRRYGDAGEMTTEYQVEVYDIFGGQRPDGSSTWSSNTAEVSDPVATINAKATWTVSGNQINLTKVSGSFVQKMGTVTNRNIIIVNETKRKLASNVPLDFSYSLNWGYQDFHDLKKETFHYVEIYGTASASGMGGSREIVCNFTYGS